jgi:PEP-CTERM motif-containing protein
MGVRSLAAGAAGATGALFLLMGAPTVAQAATNLGGCSTSDINPAAAACYGYFQGNANGNSAENQADQALALAALGLSGPYVQLEHLDISAGNIIDFDTLLNGATYISIHWGAGQGPLKVEGGTTGFYRLDLASDAQLDFIISSFGSLSNAVLWGTEECVGPGCDNNPGGEIPEPATWALMILGFGGAGVMIRRRRSSAALV